MEHLGFIHHHSKMAKGFTKFTFVIWRIFPFAKTHKLHFNRAFEANKKKLELVVKVKPLPPYYFNSLYSIESPLFYFSFFSPLLIWHIISDRIYFYICSVASHLQQNKFCINSISSCQEYEWCIIIEFCISISDASL